MRRRVDWITGSLAIIATLFIALPIFAILEKVSWSHFFSTLTSDGSLSAIYLTVWSSLLAALIATIFGVPLGWYLAKGNPRIAGVIRPIVLAPIVLPPTVAGMALLALLGRRGLLGRWIFQVTGWAAPFTSVAVVIAGVFVGLPFLTLIVESGFRKLSPEIEDAAVTDRAGNFQLFALIALPQSRSVIATGVVLAWARSIGEFGATMMFAGSLPGTTQTWSMQVYQELEVNPASAYALSAVMIAIAIIIIYSLRNQLREAFTSRN